MCLGVRVSLWMCLGVSVSGCEWVSVSVGLSPSVPHDTAHKRTYCQSELGHQHILSCVGGTGLAAPVLPRGQRLPLSRRVEG